jgi:hypothetical protein
MEIHRATTIAEEGTLAISGLPFAVGDKVEVIIRNLAEPTRQDEQYPLRGSLLRYTDPFEPVPPSAWEAQR